MKGKTHAPLTIFMQENKRRRNWGVPHYRLRSPRTGLRSRPPKERSQLEVKAITPGTRGTSSRGDNCASRSAGKLARAGQQISTLAPLLHSVVFAVVERSQRDDAAALWRPGTYARGFWWGASLLPPSASLRTD